MYLGAPPFRTQPLLTRQLSGMFRLAKTVELVRNGKPWMPQQHPGSGIAHDRPGLSPLCRLVAVNRTVGASRLVSPIGAFLQPYFGVIQELPTLGTQVFAGSVVMIGAIDAHHSCHGQPFTGQVFLLELHFVAALRFQIHKKPGTLDVLGRDVTPFAVVGVEIAASPAGEVNFAFTEPGRIEVSNRNKRRYRQAGNTVIAAQWNGLGIAEGDATDRRARQRDIDIGNDGRASRCPFARQCPGPVR